jgi:hypothetical protein
MLFASTSACGQVVPDSLDWEVRGRELLKLGQYAKAESLFTHVISTLEAETKEKSHAYTLLIGALVQHSNFLRISNPASSSAVLNVATETVVKLLSLYPCTEPDAARHPPEMVDLFEEVRSTRFGSIQLGSLEPRGLNVYVNDAPEPVSKRRLCDLEPQSYTLRFARAGYHEQLREVEVVPGSATLVNVNLVPVRNASWWWSRIGVGVSLAAGILFIVIRNAS